MSYDLIIRNGTVVDGTGAARFRADIGVKDGKITEVGKVDGTAKRTIDAEDLIVAPGFVDPHTHYDAQIFWDPTCSNAGENGITTVVTGNCGFGFAPVHVRDRERAMLMMETTEQMLEQTAIATNGTTDVEVDGKTISFKAPYARVSIFDAIKEHTGIDISGMDEDQLRDVCKQLKLETDDHMGKGKLIDTIFGELCEKHYIQPTFIIDYPVEMSPLTKKHRSKPGLVERFELMINGKEIANAYSELNDPIDQRERFEEQVRLMERGDDEAMFIDYDFLRSLEYGMPPTAGIGIGIERLAMLLTGQVSIQDVMLFPQMRPERNEA